MKLSISALAWDIHEDEEIARLLKRYDVTAIDAVPGKYFPDPLRVTEKEILQVKTWWANHGIEIVGMQSLLFGTTGLNIFGDEKSQSSMLKRLRAICFIGGVLGAKKLAFGSPKNRDRSGLTDNETLKIATDFFYKVGEIAQENGVVVCLEPNPPCYGANFMTTTLETAHVVEAVNHPAIRLQFDIGAMTINEEDVSQVLSRSENLIGHIHLSEPQLVPIGDGKTDHREISKILFKKFSKFLVTIEMLATQNEPHAVAIERALKVSQIYAD